NRHTLKNPEHEFFQSASYRALNEAIVQNQREIITFLVEDCHVNVNAHDTKNDVSLHRAIDYDDPNLITYLIEHGANPLYKNNCAHHHTVLESVDWGLACPEELGPERIAKLQEIKSTIEKALRTRYYSDPYADPESSSSSDSDGATDNDQNSDTES